MNKSILKAIDTLNQHAGKGYLWPSNIDGSVGDVMWGGRTILKGNPNNYTYCCGITLQAYLMAATATDKFLGTPDNVMKIRRIWFIAETKKNVPIYMNKGPVDALVPMGHGREVKLEEAIPGDPCQFWRQNGSGHSVIFIGRVKESGREGIKYWSTQKATNGIGYRIEFFSGVSNPITNLWVCRPI